MSELSRGPSADDIPTFSEEDDVRYMHFNSEWIQGGMDLDDPYRLVFEYAQQMMSWLLLVDPPRKPLQIGMLGLGAGSFVRFCSKYTRSQLLAVEWNPQVVAACDMFFQLPVTGKRFSLELADANLWVQDPRNEGSCRALMVDLYDAHARGPVCDSLEFYQGCKKVLTTSAGVSAFTVNLFGDADGFPETINKLKQVFDNRVWVLPTTLSGNRVALALTGDPVQFDTVTQFLDRALSLEQRYQLPLHDMALALVKHQGKKEAVEF